VALYVLSGCTLISLVIGIWNLDIICYLVLGIWGFLASPAGTLPLQERLRYK